MQFKPVVVTVNRVVPPITAALSEPRRPVVRRVQSGPFLITAGPYCSFLMVGLQCENAADSQVCVKLS